MEINLMKPYVIEDADGGAWLINLDKVIFIEKTRIGLHFGMQEDIRINCPCSQEQANKIIFSILEIFEQKKTGWFK
jgi:hypothetical protein